MNSKRIAIVTFLPPGQSPWDPDSIHSGITGSEEAVIYMAKELAELGHEVIVFGQPPKGSLHALKTANPRYTLFGELANSAPFDVAIIWRAPSIALPLKQRGFAKKVYLWPHDTISSREPVEGIDGVLWLSKWQRMQWMSVSPQYSRFHEIFGNGVDPEQFCPLKIRNNPYSCIYGSNYGRGLDLLLQIWPSIKERFPRAELDIYYGWQHWGLLDPAQERWMRETIPHLPGVKEHGQVGHLELNRAYARASFWTYPCLQAETFCITALRAQLSGAIPVILQGTALSETVRFGFKCYEKEQYLSLLLHAMHLAETVSLSDRDQMKEFILNEYTWKRLATKWCDFFM